MISFEYISGLLFLIIVWLMVFTGVYVWRERKYWVMSKSLSENNDVRGVLQKLNKENQLVKKEIKEIRKIIDEIGIKQNFNVQQVGLLRYNPFGDTGGDQSFCLSMLDGHGSGVVLSSLHNRQQTRIYAKKIKQGKSPGYTLSKEERESIKKALNS